MAAAGVVAARRRELARLEEGLQSQVRRQCTGLQMCFYSFPQWLLCGHCVIPGHVACWWGQAARAEQARRR